MFLNVLAVRQKKLLCGVAALCFGVFLTVWILGSENAAAENNQPSSIVAPPTVLSMVKFDFDGDGKADVGRWHRSNTEFKVRNSGGGTYSTYSIGSSTAVSSPGDFDGDGRTDAAVFNSGTWTIKRSSDGTVQTFSWGTVGDIPVAADFDGDGKTDIVVWRPSNGIWWIWRSSDGVQTNSTWGTLRETFR